MVTDLGILADDPDALARALQAAAAGHDLVVTSGGVSTGEADHVRSAVERIGSLVFWRVAIKPGRPVAMGVIRGANGQGAAFVGLPGNPVAVFVTFVRVVKPLLRRLAGARPQSLMPLPVRAAFAYRKKKDRREYVRVALRRAADGELEAVKHPQDGAGILTSLTETDGLLEFPEDVTAIEPGARVGFLSYAALIGVSSGRANPNNHRPGYTGPARRPSQNDGEKLRPEPHAGGAEGLVDRLLDAVEHDPADHRDDDGRHAGNDECFHGIGSSPRRPIACNYIRYGHGARPVKIFSRRNAAAQCARRAAASSGVLTLRNGSTGSAGQSATATPCRAVQTSILRRLLLDQRLAQALAQRQRP